MADERATSLTLLERVRSHDSDAWRRLHRLYAPLVGYWCGLWGVRGPDADDVTQEVFGAVAGRLGDFRCDQPGETFRGWLRGITRHKLLDLMRRRGRQPAAQGGTEAHLRLEQIAESEPALDESPAEIAGLYRRALELVRGEFEAKTWQMFWRAAVENHPVDLIATDEGVSSAAVRKAKSRVLRRLKEEVGDLVE
jgi:RNA polymerase sigma-70 factor, ECF subfamily